MESKEEIEYYYNLAKKYHTTLQMFIETYPDSVYQFHIKIGGYDKDIVEYTEFKKSVNNFKKEILGL